MNDFIHIELGLQRYAEQLREAELARQRRVPSSDWSWAGRLMIQAGRWFDRIGRRLTAESNHTQILGGAR